MVIINLQFICFTGRIMLKQIINSRNIKKYQLFTKDVNAMHNTLDKNPETVAARLLEVKNNTSLKHKQKVITAMALAKIAATHVLKMSYYDVQIMGAMAMVDGCIAEMKTGEGKTLTCSAAVAANYVLGYSTHVATANEYLAQRDCETLSALYSFMGIRSSFNIAANSKEEKKNAYACDVVYSTAQELGFDFLRDNLLYDLNEKVQSKDFNNIKCIIDEADFVLIDEARTPLIISGESPVKSEDVYATIKSFAHQLKKMSEAPHHDVLIGDIIPPGDFWLDEKTKNAYLSDVGYEQLEKLAQDAELLHINKHSQLMSLYQSENSWIIHETLNALRAHHLYIIDKDYIVQDGKIVIIDQNTGRLSVGRTWSNGLHQAIESKENLVVNPETMTMGSISIQNYFRTYQQISGMSGTVMQSTQEFEQIYGCKTISIPTNRNMVRIDHQDRVYLNMRSKYKHLVEEVDLRHKKGQPILIGTTSVAESEIISNLLHDKAIRHHVLNAKNNALEAQIISQAGQPGSVTVATSMAGRGTDIILGGNQEAIIVLLDNMLSQINERGNFFTFIMQNLGMTDSLTIQLEDVDTSQTSNFNIAHLQSELHELFNDEEIIRLIQTDTPSAWLKLFNLKQEIEYHKNMLITNWQSWREQVINIGGLCVIGSSRNESRRIDDQLRGRAGRQGDAGESIFYLSFEDPWVSVFGKTAIFGHLTRTMHEDQLISAPSVTRVFAKAQNNIESYHFDSRKNTFQYDSIADEGRKQFLKLRNSLLQDSSNIQEILFDQLYSVLLPAVCSDFLYHIEEKQHTKNPLSYVLTLPLQQLHTQLQEFIVNAEHIDTADIKQSDAEKLSQHIKNVMKEYDAIWNEFNNNAVHTLDKNWTHHLVFIDDAQRNVAFSSLAQKNPLYEYKKLCFDSFSGMLQDFRGKMMEDFLEIITRGITEPIIEE